MGQTVEQTASGSVALVLEAFLAGLPRGWRVRFVRDHFRVKARLLPGVPARVNDRHNDVVSRGTYTAMLTTAYGRRALLSESSLVDTGNVSIGRPTTQLSAR